MPNKKVKLWLKFYVTMETKNRLSVDIHKKRQLRRLIFLINKDVYGHCL